MKEINLEPIKARLAATTLGPWEAVIHHPKGSSTVFYDIWPIAQVHFSELDHAHGANAQFIAHAREDIPALIAEVERLRAFVDDLGNDDGQHLIQFTDDGWTIQHPLRERPNLFQCEVHWDGDDPEVRGVYVLNEDMTLGELRAES